MCVCVSSPVRHTNAPVLPLGLSTWIEVKIPVTAGDDSTTMETSLVIGASIRMTNTPFTIAEPKTGKYRLRVGKRHLTRNTHALARNALISRRDAPPTLTRAFPFPELATDTMVVAVGVSSSAPLITTGTSVAVRFPDTTNGAAVVGGAVLMKGSAVVAAGAVVL